MKRRREAAVPAVVVEAVIAAANAAVDATASQRVFFSLQKKRCGSILHPPTFSDGLGAPQIYFLTHYSKSIERTRNSRSEYPFLQYRFPSGSDFPSAF
jgi:hypothetical protein